MKIGAIYRHEDCLFPHTWHAISAWERTRGLLARPQLNVGEGMLIDACRLVHTVGMRYSLDLVFLDHLGRVCKMLGTVAPLRLAGSFSAQSTLELAPGTLSQCDLKIGDALVWREAHA